VLRGFQGLAVMVGGRFALAQLVEADGQVEAVIGVAAVQATGLEVGGLSLMPAALPGEQIAQGKVEGRGVGLFLQQGFQAAFRAFWITAGAETKVTGQGAGIFGVGSQGCLVELQRYRRAPRFIEM